jgi:PAS domain S-box-containing protein
MNPSRILIVEDDAIVAMNIEDRLLHLGYQLGGHAVSGDQAVQLTQERQPSLVLMDIHLQGAMDGITAATEIRRRFQVPVIFLTAYSEDETLERANLAYPFGYILKPFNDYDLKSAIEIALFRHNAETEIRRLNRLYDVLIQVNQTLVRVQSREELLTQACQIMVERGNLDLAWIGWLDQDMARIRPVAFFGNKYEILNQRQFFAHDRPERQGKPGRALREGRPFVCTTCCGDTCLYPSRQALERFGFQSCGSFPLRFQGQVCGVLTLSGAESDFFGEREIKLLEEVALDISFGLDKLETEAQRQRLHDQVRHQAAFLDSLLDAIPLPVIYKDSQLRYLGCNRAYQHCMRVKEEDVVGKTVHELFPKEVADLHHLSDLELLQTHKPRIYEAAAYNAWGEFREIVSHKAVFHNPDGSVGGIIGAMEDITARKQAETELRRAYDEVSRINEKLENSQLKLEAQNLELHQVTRSLQESQTRFSDLYDFAPVGYLTMDEKGLILESNLTLATMLGVKRSVLALTPLAIYLDGNTDKKKFYHYLRKIFKHTGHQRCELKLLRAGGGYTFVLLDSLVSETPAEDLKTCRTSVTDISALKQAEEMRLQAEAQLRQAQKIEAIGILAGGIAHDFNNILMAIMGNAEMAGLVLPADNKANKFLEQVLSASCRARDLVQQILTFSRRLDTKKKPLQLATVIKEALQLVRASLPSTIEISTNLASQHKVLADATQIHQIILNLASNACHAMRVRGGTLEVRLSDTVLTTPLLTPHGELAVGSYVRLEVKDTGKGIPPEVIGRIFEPYFTMNDVGEGTGMGLATVLGIVKTHGGDILVESKPGQGTTFVILLPGLEANLLEEESGGDKPLHKGSGRILFVDDEPALIDFGEEALTSLGYEVIAIKRSPAALEIFRANPSGFDLVITDLTMPNLTGVDLAQKIQEIRADIPIILCTGYSDQFEIEDVSKMGISAFLSKPLGVRQLAEVVHQFLAIPPDS